MKIFEKMPYAEAAIRSISQHHDADAAVRLAALNAVKAFCDGEAEAINAEIAAELAAEGLGEG